MSSDNKILLLVVGVTVAILAFGIFMLGKSGTPKPQIEEQVVEIDYSKGQKIGSDSAKVRLVEFSDFQCPACRNVFPEVDILLKSNLENFQFIYRHYPLPQHRNAKKAAVVSEFAGQKGKFFEMSEKLFATQAEWEALSDPTDFFVNLVSELGLNTDEARVALKDNLRMDVINDDINEGTRVGVDSTPTFYLNGKKVNLGPNMSLNQLVKEELAK
jgi:protein-disulfide isomerase